VKQSIYILNKDFFEKGAPLNFDDVAERIDKLTDTERLILVYDPICGKVFQDLAKKHEDDILKDILISYYGMLEKRDKHKLSWNQLTEELNHHIGVMNEILISVDFLNVSVSATGVLPFKMSDKKLFLYYHINPYIEVEDKLYLIKEQEYIQAVGNILKKD
jgi:hypothetical protein